VIGAVYRWPSAWNTRRSPRGETVACWIIFTSNVAGATATGKRTASAILRVLRTRKGISVAAPVATSTRRIFPAAQKTSELPSGVQAMAG
jgi:hypothetical protein